MKGADVISKLIQELPKHSGLFFDNLSISSLSRAGSTVTATTTVPHGLSNGHIVVINGAKSPLTITSITQVDGVATAVCLNNHDLTEGWEGQTPSDSPNIEISGADQAEYNGVHQLLSVVNRKTFTFSVSTTAASPATGSPKLLEQFASGYNGAQAITVVDASTFTYPITTTPESPAQGTITAAKGARISGAVDIETARQSYTAQASNELWAFVVIEDTAANKDRRDDTDATFTNAAGTEYRQRIITPFSVYVFAPSTDEIAARAARDLMHDVRVSLFKVLLRSVFSDGFTAQQVFTTSFNGDGFVVYDGSSYVHRFVFEVVSDITYNDTAKPSEHVAFRDVALNFNDDLGTTELSVTANLDEQPLP